MGYYWYCEFWGTWRAGHHQPDLGHMNWETSEDRHPKSRTPPVRLCDKFDIWDKSRQTSKEPDAASQTRRQMNWETSEGRPPKSRTPPARPWEKWNGDKWRQTSYKSRAPPARLHGRQLWFGRQVKTDIQRDGHHQRGWEVNAGRQLKPDWETNGLRWETSEYRRPKSRTPPARRGDKWIGTHLESQTPPPGKRRKPIKRELRPPTVNCLGHYFQAL